MFVVTIANIFLHLIMSTLGKVLDLVMEFLAGLGGL